MKFLIVLGLVAVSSGVPQRFRAREGRQNSYLAPPEAAPSDVDAAYLAPSDGYGAASEDSADYAPLSDNYGAASEDAPLESYAAASDESPVAAPSDSYGAAASEDSLSYDDYDPSDVPADQAAPQSDYTPADDSGEDMGLKMLMNAVPGTPGDDYPIYAEAPETGFSCDGQVNGGYYADAEAECQVFHVCTADAEGGLNKYSFLCPNGTIFNQNYFICDWWFNFDCADAEAIASEKNAELADAREAASVAAASETDAAFASPNDVGYGAPEAAASDDSLSGYEQAGYSSY